MRERWDLYDAEDKPTGEVILRGERIPKGRYHRVVEAWLRTKDGHLILQKRSKKKKNSERPYKRGRKNEEKPCAL